MLNILKSIYETVVCCVRHDYTECFQSPAGVKQDRLLTQPKRFLSVYQRSGCMMKSGKKEDIIEPN